MCVCVCVCVWARARVCACACVRACVLVCVCGVFVVERVRAWSARARVVRMYGQRGRRNAGAPLLHPSAHTARGGAESAATPAGGRDDEGKGREGEHGVDDEGVDAHAGHRLESAHKHAPSHVPPTTPRTHTREAAHWPTMIGVGTAGGPGQAG